MVYKKQRKNMRKKPYRRRYNKYRKLRNKVPNGASPVAAKHVVKLKYSDTIDWSVTTLNTGLQVFRLNSVYDPDLTSAGHQPYGYDQLTALFTHYRVFKCSWHIQFAPSNDRVHICVLPVNGNSPTTFTLAGESPRAVTKAMGYNGGVPCNFKGTCYLPRLTGATSVQYRTDDRYSSANNNNPTELMQLAILVYNPTGVTIDTSMSVTLSYHTEFYDPILLGQS